MIQIGDVSPEFCLLDNYEQEVCLNTYKGRWVVVYFYLRDNTNGCTREAVDFTNALEALRALGADVLGISPDSLASHKEFAEKHGLKVKLLSDPDHKVIKAYGVWDLKKMRGRDGCIMQGYGVIRSTFLIDPKGHIAHYWQDVEVKGHVDEVIKTLENLKNTRR